MSNPPLDRFAGLIGQQKAKRLLSRALQQNRLAHAYLFQGPEGVGKMTAAKMLAATLLCHTGPDTPPCQCCNGCHKFNAKVHPDFLLIEPDGISIKINQTRDLKKQVRFAPLEASTRIIILDQIQTMRREAANAFLKLLEEPPANNLFLLVAAEEHPLLPTILSRCQLIPFFPLTTAQTAALLAQQAPERSAMEREILAELANGSPGQALALQDPILLSKRQEILTALLLPPSDLAIATTTALELAAESTAKAVATENLLDLLSRFFQQAFILQQTGPDYHLNGVKANPTLIQATERWNSTQLSAMLQDFETAKQDLASHCNPSLVCEVLFLNLLDPAR